MTAVDLTSFHAIWTVVLLAVFVGICAWAWSARRRPDFERYARMALDDDLAPGEGRRPEENGNG